jgi:hypothetical protein
VPRRSKDTDNGDPRTLEEIRDRLAELDAEFPDQRFTDEQRDEWERLSAKADELKTRREWIAELARDPGNHDTAAPYRRPATTDQLEATVAPHARANRDSAMRTVERHVNAGNLTAQAADRVDDVLRGPDAGFGLDARYIETHGSPAYERAFAKLLRFGDTAALRMTLEEQQAVQSATAAEEMRTAMAEGTGSNGWVRDPDPDRPDDQPEQ